jgi:hypothetical protein
VSLPARELEVFLRFTKRLEEAGVDYMVSGSVGAMFYGQPRFTTDIDLIVWMDLTGARRLAELFSSEEFYFPPMDIVATELVRERRGHFNILHVESGFKADVYLRGNDPLRAWALERVRRFEVGGGTIRVAPPEYVIVRKLEFYREGGSEKHLRDIRMMVENSIELIDGPALENLIAERGLEA